jgi:glycosyltransferase involved in cell wall biosynthesis
MIAGDGPLRPGLEKLADALGISDHIEFLGWRDDTAEVLSHMTIFCLPSVWEGFGIVLLEAMLARKPVVASNVGGVPEVVEDGRTGVLVPVGDVDALARALTSLLLDDGLAARMGEAGRARVEKDFSFAKMIEEYERLYNALASH